MSVSSLIFKKLLRLKRGTPFSIESFYSLGTTTAVQKAMSRLTQKGEIVRVDKGIYVRPKHIESIPFVKVTAKAEDVAKVWAKRRGYELVPQGLESAYRLGLQTQAPLKVIYWSSGPSRIFRVENQVVQIKHTANSKLQWPNKPEGELLRGLMFVSVKHTTTQQLEAALRRLNISREEKLIVVDKLIKCRSLSLWKHKLIKLKQYLQQV
ncbi:hypothetical protein EYS14_06025 [Alteromonadaceae bacterium M269]|nr:hypothetical protein EYS14_06025 [Alteromonadaceae bacterium M269]